MATPQYLQKENIGAAGSFVNGALWLDIKRVLMERRPAAAEAIDPPDVAAAKGHIRNGFEQCIALIEAVPFETPADAPVNPFDRPALASSED